MLSNAFDVSSDEKSTEFDNSGVNVTNKYNCILCNNHGKVIHSDLDDTLFGSPGLWSFIKCNNSDCGLVWIAPCPTQDNLWKLYANYYTHDSVVIGSTSKYRYYVDKFIESYLELKYGYKQAGKPHFSPWFSALAYLHPGRRAEFDARVFYLEHIHNGRLLEVGCGSGANLSFMKKLGWQVEGVDFDPKAVQVARSNGLDVYAGSLEEQGLPSNTYDAIVMAHVIEHVHNPVQLLTECYRILKPVGKLIVITPNADGMGHAVFGRKWRGLEPPRHLHIFNPASLSALVKLSGFAGLTCRSHGMGRYIIAASLSQALYFPKIVTAARNRIIMVLAEFMGLAGLLLHKMTKKSSDEIALIAVKPLN